MIGSTCQTVMLKTEKNFTENELKGSTNDAQLPKKKTFQIPMTQMKKMSEAQDISSEEKAVEGEDKESDVNPEKDPVEKQAEDEKLVDELIPPPSQDNLNQDLAEEEGDKEELVQDIISEGGENADPLSEANINEEEDPLANDTPSRKVLPPPCG